MKSINELYQEVKNDEALKEKFLDAYAKEEIGDFLKENDCDATVEEALKFAGQVLSSGMGELSDEELALVVGGGGKAKKGSEPKHKKGERVSFETCGTAYAHRTGVIIKVMPDPDGHHRYEILLDYFESIITVGEGQIDDYYEY